LEVTPLFLGWYLNNKDLNTVKGWPEGFLNDNIKQSNKAVSKFNL